MGESGDWITPRLMGQPWFEKPALLYWLIGLGHEVGLPGEWAARLPVAMLSVAFLGYFAFALRQLSGATGALFSAIMLGTTAGWIAFSQVAATDLPLAATFAGGVFTILLAAERDWKRGYWVAGVFFGLALLAKGLVAAVLAAPLVVLYRRHFKGLLKTGICAAVVAAAWYGPMFAVHGRAFFDEFFLRHHFGRFASNELQHVQPFWFYVPVLLGWLFPWTVMAVEAPFRAGRIEDESQWRRALAWTAGWGFAFFSASTNKLPGYVVPLLPLTVALMGDWLARERPNQRRLFWTGCLLFVIPVAAAALPEALLHGITKVTWEGVPWEYFAGGACVGIAAEWLELRGRRTAAVASIAAAVCAGIVYVKLSAFPVLDRVVSARSLAERVKGVGEPVCVESLHRSLRYGLDYYLGSTVPDCETSPKGVRIVQPRGGLPVMQRSAGNQGVR